MSDRGETTTDVHPRAVYTLPQLLQASAARHPWRTAVEDGDRKFSYADLSARSDALADSLRSRGVARGDRVGVFLTKSAEAVVAIFGIMKAGAAYVPLDPQSPIRRVAYIVTDCQMKAIVSDGSRFAKLESALGPAAQLRVAVLRTPLSVDSGRAIVIPWDDATATSPDARTPPSVECDLAYILYTSGSTGEPKGVMVSHRAALTFVNWAGDTIGVRPDDRLSQHAPLHFDLSTFDIFSSVRAGATTVLVPPALSVFPRSLADFIASRNITVWYSVPSVLTSLVTDGELGRHDYARLRAIIFAGEVFPTKYLRRLMDEIPGAEYHNWYGPTETNVCTYYRVSSIPDGQTEPIPIGHGCENSEVFALAADGREAAVDTPGELYVHGPSLMEGYWGLPERTSEALVPHPLQPRRGRFVYRTGDLVKLGSDGEYRFLGRSDHMVKIRGYRVELGEVEAALYGHEDVVAAVALAVPDVGGTGQALKAIVVARETTTLDARSLEAHCAAALPKYMMPAVFEFRETLPMTSTGKVDRSLLLKMHLEATLSSPS